MLEPKASVHKRVQRDVLVRHRSFAFMSAAALFLTLPACSYSPTYADGGVGFVAARLAEVEVSPIVGRAGSLMRNALTDRLGAGGEDQVEPRYRLRAGGMMREPLNQGHGMGGRDQPEPRYRLDVRLDDSLGLGAPGDDTIGREPPTLRARYQLVDLGTGEILLESTAASDAGIDVASSDRAAATEQRALENLTDDVADRIVTHPALTRRDQP